AGEAGRRQGDRLGQRRDDPVQRGSRRDCEGRARRQPLAPALLEAIRIRTRSETEGAIMEAQPKGSADTVRMLRLWILGVLVLGLLGTVVELVLLSHYEQPVQLVPVVLLVLALIVLAW